MAAYSLLGPSTRSPARVTGGRVRVRNDAAGRASRWSRHRQAGTQRWTPGVPVAGLPGGAGRGGVGRPASLPGPRTSRRAVPGSGLPPYLLCLSPGPLPAGLHAATRSSVASPTSRPLLAVDRRDSAPDQCRCRARRSVTLIV